MEPIKQHARQGKLLRITMRTTATCLELHGCRAATMGSMENVSIDWWVTSLRQNGKNVVCEVHIPALITCWTAKFLKNTEVPIHLTSFALACTAVWSLSEADLFASLMIDLSQKEMVFLVTHFFSFLLSYCGVKKLLQVGQC